MKEKSLRKKIKLIVTMLIISVIALTFVAISFAWMSANRKVKSNGLQVVLDNSAGVTAGNVMILKREGADGAKDVSDRGSIILTEYDTVFTDKNVNTPLLVRIEVNNISPDSNGDYADITLEIVCNNDKEGKWKDEDGKLNRVLSNIVFLSCAAGDAELNTKTNLEDIYISGIAYLGLHAQQKTFVSYTKEGQRITLDGTKASSLSFTVSNYEDKLQDGKLVLYVEINYDQNLIQAYVDQHGVEVGEDAGLDSVSFESDLTSFKLKTQDK